MTDMSEIQLPTNIHPDLIDYNMDGSRLLAGFNTQPDSGNPLSSPTEMQTINRYRFDSFGILDLLGILDENRAEDQIAVIETHNAAWRALNQMLVSHSETSLQSNEQAAIENIKDMMLLIMVTENTLPQVLLHTHTEFTDIFDDINHKLPENRIAGALEALGAMMLEQNAADIDDRIFLSYLRTEQILKSSLADKKYHRV